MNRTTIAGKASVSLLCETFKLSRAAYYPRKDAKERGGTRVTDVVALPKKPRYTVADVVLAGIRRVIADNPAWGVRKVWATLRADGMRVSRKRIWALMHAHGLVLARDSEPGEPRRGHVAVPEPNRRFATDLTTTWTRRDGVVAIVPTIDCGCRSTLSLVVTKDQHGPAVLTSVELALTTAFGAPENVPDGVELRTDHGPQYTGADCEALVDKWGLLHTYAPVGRPTGNAVVERFIRTMKEEVVWLRDWESADDLRAALDAWLVRYNERRPHQSLAWKTPATFRAEKLGINGVKAAA
jgi:transposase InsO family protein